MITLIDLSSPRKSAESIANHILFQRKMKKSHLPKYNGIAYMFFLYLLMNSKYVMAKEVNSTNDIVNFYDYFISFLQAIGFPTIDVMFNCIRFRKHLLDYIKYSKQS